MHVSGNEGFQDHDQYKQMSIACFAGAGAVLWTVVDLELEMLLPLNSSTQELKACMAVGGHKTSGLQQHPAEIWKPY